jgi:hypothetical protein
MMSKRLIVKKTFLKPGGDVWQSWSQAKTRFSLPISLRESGHFPLEASARSS